MLLLYEIDSGTADLHRPTNLLLDSLIMQGLRLNHGYAARISIVCHRDFLFVRKHDLKSVVITRSLLEGKQWIAYRTNQGVNGVLLKKAFNPQKFMCILFDVGPTKPLSYEEHPIILTQQMMPKPLLQSNCYSHFSAQQACTCKKQTRSN